MTGRFQTLKARWKNIHYFAAIVRSPATVRGAFSEHRILFWWWKAVLMLHGKPSEVEISECDRRGCIAAGFRFYGSLYRTLAVCLGGMAIYCWASDFVARFWIFYLTAAGVSLWIT